MRIAQSICFLATVLAVTPLARADRLSENVVVTIKRGENCNSATSVEAKFTNNNNVSLDVRICLERDNGKWDSGLKSNLRPGKSGSYYVCKGTGRYKVFVRPAGSKEPLPKP